MNNYKSEKCTQIFYDLPKCEKNANYTGIQKCKVVKYSNSNGTIL